MAGMAMMGGQLGRYSMMRDASGTSWNPDSTPMEGFGWRSGGWTGMTGGYIDIVSDHQGGDRGATMAFAEGMVMAMAQRSLGGGVLTLRSMISPDPFMGPDGYPLLLQTGETADGITPLVDRQHPHDLFMELAAVYSYARDSRWSTFLYVGYPGEPALGPPTFMHRFSGMDDPVAPITHHWIDSTHITFGVVTLGIVDGPWKLEGSVFNGREPDQNRWDFDTLRLDSYAARLSLNPAPDWALQVSYGYIASPEQLTPEVSQQRITASAIYNRPLKGGNWQTTFAWGRNANHPGHSLNGLLAESALNFGRHTLFARAEYAQKDELFVAPDPRADTVYDVGEVSFGYVYDLPVARRLALGFGFAAAVNFVPEAIAPVYGGSSPVGYMPFLRLKVR